jgi:AcrR family transcriptional regulator
VPISAEVQLERRTKLLSRTREMIQEYGVDNLNVRELAQYCGVSVPTIYAQFDSKDNLIAMAADEMVRMHFERIGMLKGKKGLARLLQVCDSIGEAILKNPEFFKVITRRVPSGMNNSLSIPRSLYTQGLKEMQEKGELVEWVSTDFLGKLIYEHIKNTTVEWSIGHLSDNEVIARRRCELALALLGLTTGTTQKKLITLLRENSAFFT